jgi:hypothetical protein
MQTLWQNVLNADPAWTASAWLLVSGGLFLLLYALFRNRSGLWGIPRERCPRCWYNLSGHNLFESDNGTLVCPECGKRIASRRALRRTHRRWGLACLALAFLLCGHLAHHKQHIRVYGWIYMVPSVVLFLAVDADEWVAWATGGPASQTKERFYAEVEARFCTAPLWQRAIWMSRLRPAIESGELHIRDTSTLFPIQIEAGTGWVNDEWTGLAYPPRSGISRATEETTCEFIDLVINAVEQEDWIDNGGDSNSLFQLREYTVFRASAETMAKIDQLLADLGEDAQWPDEIDDARPVDGKWMLSFPLADLLDSHWVATFVAEHRSRDESRYSARLDDDEAMFLSVTQGIEDDLAASRIQEPVPGGTAESLVFITEGWFQNRVIVLCDAAARSRVIGEMTRIRTEGPTISPD